MLANRAIAIALTGPFGSGSTTAAGFLSERKDFHHIRLSKFVKNRLAKGDPGKPHRRSDLQKLGNQIRVEEHAPGILALWAIQELKNAEQEFDRIVFDGIRNLGEIEILREQFGVNFYLIAFECKPSERWERVRGREYEPFGMTEVDFKSDNDEDRDQETVYGQQVQLCVDASDVLIDNDSDITLAQLRSKLDECVDLLTGSKPRYATPNEIYMNLAYSSSHGSKCLKRQVGAVLVAAKPDEMGEVVGVGFNENPVGTKPCVEEPYYGADATQNKPGRCYRDIVRAEAFVNLARERRRCPACGTVIAEPISELPPWSCANCEYNLEKSFWPERAMTLCTAVHAEVQAILTAQGRARNTTLYTTTFPCFQCAEKITQAGVRFIVYTEPYPDIRAARRLDIAEIEVVRFDGIRSRRFDEIFSRARPYMSALKKRN